MNRLKLKNCPSDHKLKEVMTKAYALRSSEYVVSKIGNDSVIVLNESDKDKDSRVFLTTNPGAFKGYLSFYPALNKGAMHTYDEVMKYVVDEGVCVNVDEDTIKESFDRFSDGEILENILIAEGVMPINGKNAEINVHFGVPENRPKVVDGKIDYKAVDNIVMVNRGELLITKKPATPGSRGITIRKDEVSPLPGKDFIVLLGDGATVDEAGTSYFATLDGCVDYNGRKLTVSPIYIVKGNVDYSTGNIKFNGSVHVKGDVLPGFKVEADRHILVDGICQDCELNARENVILRTGIKGSGGSFIKAGGSAIIGYCEKTKIEAKENVEIKKYAFNCDVMAGNRIEASSAEGIVAGGTLQAFQEISVKQMGTQGNSSFSLSLGTKYYIESELDRIRKEKIKIGDTLLHVDVALGRFDLGQPKIKSHPKILKMLEVKDNLNLLMKDLADREDKLTSENKARNPRVKVKGRVFEGLSLTFFDTTLVVKQELENVVFYYEEKFDEIAWVSLKNIGSIELND